MKDNIPYPPRWAKRLLNWLAAPHLREELEGDLEELFRKRLEQYGYRKAWLFYWLDLVLLVHPRLWRKAPVLTFYQTHSLYTDMLIHHLLLAYRTCRRFKSSFFINLIGLSTGLACALLIYLWVQDERSVDKFHHHDRRLFQVMHNLTGEDGRIQTIEGTPGRLAQALAEEIPEIERATSVVPAQWFSSKAILSLGNTSMEAAGQFIGAAYFQMFTCPFVAGDPNGVLRDKHNVAISSQLAEKLFASPEQALGKTVTWNQGEFNDPYVITGVFSKPPANATATFDVLLNYELFLEKRTYLQDWGNSDPSTFVLLRETADADRVNTKIKHYLQTKLKATANTLFLQRYSDRYLYNHYANGQVAGGRIAYVQLFSLIAGFILLIACVNFMNLSTAKATGRMKEVGVKKAIGASRQALIGQYLVESVLLALVSLLLALCWVGLLLPSFNELTQKTLALHWDTQIVVPLLALTLVTGVVAGSYPALYLSGFKPVLILKGKLQDSAGERWIRKGLVVFQFAVSVLLMVSVIIVYQQINFVQKKNLGYNRDHILLFDLPIHEQNDSAFLAPGGILEQKIETFLSQAKQLPGVVGAANYYHDVLGLHGGLGLDWQPGDQDEKMAFANLEEGYDFIETLGIELREGRSFSRSFSHEQTKIIFNEEAIRRMGLQDPVGKTVKVWGQEKQIIGVVKNFHFESLYQPIKPCLFQLEPRGNRIMVKIKAGTESQTIARLQQLFRQHRPGMAFEYTFLDKQYQSLYAAEQRGGILTRYFAGIALVISCLGLFGLAAFTAERRSKEIGIRRVLGATEAAILYLLGGSFTRPVLLAVLLALPVSYLLANQWLERFVYRIELEAWFFLLAGLLAFTVALLTVGFQAAKAAFSNPVQSLKEE